MRYQEENWRYEAEEASLAAAAIGTPGSRDEQQDAAGFLSSAGGFLAILSDGMGGMSGGRQASALAVDVLTAAFEKAPGAAPGGVFLAAADEADRAIAALTRPDGKPLRAGATLCAALVRQRRLYWLSVGDSRLYLFRKGELVQVSHDHTYAAELARRLSAGEITEAVYRQEMTRGEALFSFLGAGGLAQVDLGGTGLLLREDDAVLLCSDGLYRLVPDAGIASVLANFRNPADAAAALEAKAARAAAEGHIARDNCTVIVLRIKEEEA